MFYLNTLSNSFVLGEKDNEGKIIKQLGFPKGGLTYLITNSNNIKFYLKEDYFYKNVVWSADVPLVIDGIPIGIDALPTALKKIFHQEVESGSVDLDFDTESFNAIANAPVSNRFNDIEDSIEAISGEIPTKTSELINDSGFITSQDIPSFSGKLDTSVFEAYSAATATELLNYFDSAEYDSQEKKINFKHGNTIKASIDATAFIKDGMVDDVRIENGNLVIVFNSDSGKEAISIPLTDIFNPNNYYSKQETDALLDEKLDASAYTPSQDVIVDTELSPTSVNPVQNKAIFDKVTLPGSGTIFVEYSTSAESFTVPDINQIKLDVSELSYTSPSIQFTLRSNSGETYDVIGMGTYDFSNNEWALSNGFGDVTYSIENNIITFISPTHTIGYVWLFGFDKLSTLIPTEGKDWLKDVVSSHTANTEIHVTEADKATWNAKSDFSGDYNDLTNKPAIPSKTSDLTNDSDFATTGDVQTATADMATKTWVGNQGYLTEHQSLDNYYTKSETSGATQIQTALNGKADSSTVNSLNNVVTAHTANTSIHVSAEQIATWNAKSDFSGDYNDLTNKPTIPTVPTSNTAFTNDAGYITIDAISGKVDTTTYNTYTASTDTALASKADTATTYTKTEVDNAITAAASTKQDTLISGTSIKTINNDSILGSGNIELATQSDFETHTGDTTIHVTASEKATWNAKSDFSGDYNDLDNKPTIPTVPTSNTAFTNDAGYITSSALDGYATTGDVQTATADMATKTWVGNQGYLTEHQSLDNYYTKTESDDLLDTKLDASAYTPTDLSNYYTKSETSGATQIQTALASKADTATTYTKTEVDTALGGKQATLQSGTNIKTINNESILGSGNITIEGGNNVVELTQAQFDALVEKDPDTFYIITDAEVMDINNYYTKTETNTLLDTKLDASAYTPTDLSNYYTKSETSGATQISTALASKADTATTYTKSEVDTALNDKVNISDNNVSAFSDYKVALEAEKNYISDNISTFYLGTNKTNNSGTGNLVTITTTDTNYPTITINCRYSNGNIIQVSTTSGITSSVKNGVAQITLTSGTLATVVYTSNGGVVFLYKQYTSGQTADVVEDTVYDALKELSNNKLDYIYKDEIINSQKTFLWGSTSDKPIIFKQTNNEAKLGFICKNSASTNNELATFEFRPDTYTDSSSVKHPLMYLGHYRNNNAANAGVPQTMVGFRQYDQKGGAAYHYLMPLPAEAKTPFSLTASFKNYFAPLGFKNGSTMITTDNTGVADFSDVLGGLKLVKLSQSEYDSLATKDNSTLYVIVN